MVDKTTIQFEIDAKNAKRGADNVDKAINRIGVAMDKLEKRVADVNSVLNKPFNTESFNRLAEGIGKLNGLKVSASLSTNLGKLSTTMSGMKVIKKPVADSITRFQTAVDQFSDINLGKIDALSKAMSGLRGPPPSAPDRIRAMAKALHEIKLPANIHEITRAFNSIGLAANNAAQGIHQLGRARINLGGINSQVNAGSGALNRFGIAGGLAQNALWQLQAAAGAYIFGGFLKQAYETHNAMYGLEVAFEAVTGSVQGSKDAMAFANVTATKYGFGIEQLSKEYLKFNAAAGTAGIKTTEIEKLFEQVAGTSAVLKLGTERTGRAFQALTQMISKGQVTAEELKQQLGEHIPGAVNIFADALGVGTKELLKMVESGEVGVREVLKFGNELEKKFGPAFEAASKSAQASLGRLTIGFTLFSREIGRNFYDALGNAATDLVSQFTYIENGQTKLTKGAMEMATKIGNSIASMATAVGNAAAWILENFEAVKMAVLGFLGLRIAGWVAATVLSFNALATAVSTATFFLGAKFVGALTTMAPAIVAAISGVQKFATAVIVAIRSTSLAALVSPWGLALGAILAVTAAVYYFSDGVQDSTTILGNLANVWFSVQDAALQFFAWITDKIVRLGELFSALGTVIEGTLAFDYGTVKAGWASFYDALANQTKEYHEKTFGIALNAEARKLDAAKGIARERTVAIAGENQTELENHISMNDGKIKSDRAAAKAAVGDVVEANTAMHEATQAYLNSITNESTIAFTRKGTIMRTYVAESEAGFAKLGPAARAVYNGMSEDAKASFDAQIAAGKSATLQIEEQIAASEGIRVKITEQGAARAAESKKAFEETLKLNNAWGETNKTRDKFNKGLTTSKDYTSRLNKELDTTRSSTDAATRSAYSLAKGYNAAANAAARMSAAANPRSASMAGAGDLTQMQGKYGNYMTDIGRKSSEYNGTGDSYFYNSLPKGNSLRQAYESSQAGNASGGGNNLSSGSSNNTKGFGSMTNSNTSSSVSGSVAKVSTKKREFGGSVQRGVEYTVGEAGPELFLKSNKEIDIVGGGGQEQWIAPSAGMVYTNSQSNNMVNDSSLYEMFGLGTTGHSNSAYTRFGAGMTAAEERAEAAKTAFKLAQMNRAELDKPGGNEGWVLESTDNTALKEHMQSYLQSKMTVELNKKFHSLYDNLSNDASSSSWNKQTSKYDAFSRDLTAKMNEQYKAYTGDTEWSFQPALGTQREKGQTSLTGGGVTNYQSNGKVSSTGGWGYKDGQKVGGFSYDNGGSSNKGSVYDNSTGLAGLQKSLDNAGRGRVGAFQTGGSFDVPSNGSGDSTIANLLLSGGERVDITPARNLTHSRAQAERNMEGGDGKKTVIINMEIKTPDPDAFRLSEKQMRTRLARQLSDI